MQYADIKEVKMATDPRHERVGNGYAHRNWEDLAVAEDHAGWVARSRVMLTPIAASSIMGRPVAMPANPSSPLSGRISRPDRTSQEVGHEPPARRAADARRD